MIAVLEENKYIDRIMIAIWFNRKIRIKLDATQMPFLDMYSLVSSPLCVTRERCEE